MKIVEVWTLERIKFDTGKRGYTIHQQNENLQGKHVLVEKEISDASMPYSLRTLDPFFRKVLNFEADAQGIITKYKIDYYERSFFRWLFTERSLNSDKKRKSNIRREPDYNISIPLGAFIPLRGPWFGLRRFGTRRVIANVIHSPIDMRRTTIR